MNRCDFEKISVLGSEFHRVQNPDVLAIMERWIHQEPDRCHFIVNTGFHGLWTAYNDPGFREIVKACDLFSPDGIATVWISKLKKKPIADRATSAELMTMYFERANTMGYGSFFFGDTWETLQAMRSNLQQKYPGHAVAGMHSPPFRPLTVDEDTEIVKRINDSGADVLWVGLGLPKQERWIHAHKDRLTVPVAIGVGACFGFFSGRVKRAPQWIGRTGFEWLWRFAMEPKKLWRRDLIDGPQFLFHVAVELLGLKKYDHSTGRDLIRTK
jgi:N-acetylglucosaminyldiphosphoundecaprenol N-acetyl-beta-D-mannosaminyltransferase